MPRPPLRAVTTALVLALLGGLFVVRGARLAADPRALSSFNEARYYRGFWREPRVAELFAEVERRLEPGEPVTVLVLPSPPRHARWWRFMASYHLPGHRVDGPATGRPETLRPGEGTVVFVSPEGEARVFRDVAVP